MRILCGLRNPGSEYQGTRHNLGYETVLALSRRWDAKLKRGPLRVRAEVAKVAGRDLLMATNNTFMNEAGRSIGSLVSYYKVESSDLLVIHDDIDLGFARLRLQRAGGSGGHNGIRSIEQHLGTPDFWRLKIGVGRPPGSQDPAQHVLRRFAKAELDEVSLLIEDAADVAEHWLVDPARAQERAALRRPASGP